MSKSILIIDDDPYTVSLMTAVLGDFFQVKHADSGQEGLKMAHAIQPQLILLDVEMSGMDGYEVCGILKSDPATADLPVIFISANDDPDSILKGYDCGGADYIVKPFDPKLLRRKITIFLRFLEEKRSLEEKAQAASKTAMTALINLGDVGRILTFLRDTVSVTGYSDIAEASLRLFEDAGLDASIQLRSHEGCLSKTIKGICSPLEEQVLSNMATCGRIVDLGKRSAFNFPHVTIIIRNMPRDDPMEYARVKDNAAIVVEIIELHMQSLTFTFDTIKRGDDLLNIVHRSASALRDIEQRQRRQREASENILNQLVNDIEDAFVYMGLSETQELQLQKLARDAIGQAQTLNKEFVETDSIMQSLGEGMDAMLQQELQGASEASLDSGSRIELF
ncbi:response regulator [Burkholderiaceae bacterium DAT-1]|nr:response regulator [Burkholderiaceae bacterium DAT-1]